MKKSSRQYDNDAFVNKIVSEAMVFKNVDGGLEHILNSRGLGDSIKIAIYKHKS